MFFILNLSSTLSSLSPFSTRLSLSLGAASRNRRPPPPWPPPAPAAPTTDAPGPGHPHCGCPRPGPVRRRCPRLGSLPTPSAAAAPASARLRPRPPPPAPLRPHPALALACLPRRVAAAAPCGAMVGREGRSSQREIMGGPARPWRWHVFLIVSLQLLLVAPRQDKMAARALNFTRQDFPRAFVFGAGTSAYQVGRISKARASFVVHLLVQPLGGCLKRVLGLTSS
jgi:hypothetical protein